MVKVVQNGKLIVEVPSRAGAYGGGREGQSARARDVCSSNCGNTCQNREACSTGERAKLDGAG